MMSSMCERAVADAIKHGKAILKFISANDVGLTGGHQAGFYLPRSIWQVFTPHKPERGVNNEHTVSVLWPDGIQTVSKVKWYGAAKSEYRLTRFGRDFPWRTFDNLGSLLVLIPKNVSEFIAYVLDIDEDIEEIQAALGVEVLRSWCLYEKGQAQPETEDICLNRHFRAFAGTVEKFPEVKVFSSTTRLAILDCVTGFADLAEDEQLIRLIREEYALYRMVERQIYQPEVQRLFASIDDFLQTALSILQARKSRAGRSLENQVEYLLKGADIPYQMRQLVDNTRPDIIIPDKAAYLDFAFPEEKLFMIGVKMTCKDRWRQVTKEAPRIKQKHILTLQEGISSNQLDEMYNANVTLIVPQSLHKEYPKERKAVILSVHGFIDSVRKLYVA